MRIYKHFYIKQALKIATVVAGSTLLMPAAHAEMSAKATELTNIAGIPITNSMVTSWVLSALIIFLIRFLVKKPQLIPTKGQYVVETLVQGVQGLIEPIVGKKLLKPTFPLLIGFFTFILLQNWSGLFPGVGTIGFMDDHDHFQSYIRPANADLNMTLALAIVHFGAWLYFVMRYAGAKILLFDLFGNKADKKETPTFMFILLTVIFFFVGIIEVVSITFPPLRKCFWWRKPSPQYDRSGGMDSSGSILLSRSIGRICPSPRFHCAGCSLYRPNM
jgi:F-type H+-transporting ATPase subunit a